MSTAERVFQLLLWIYPADFRAAYGREMMIAFRDLRRQKQDAHGTRFWARLLWDVSQSAPALRMEAFRAQWNRCIQTEDERMRIMAILAMLTGAFEAANALTEAWAGGVVNRDGYSLIWGTLGALGGTLLLSSGVALLRRSSRAARFAWSAAIACLAVFALIGIIQPRMSIIGTLLGTAFPIGLMLSLYWTRSRQQSAPVMT